MANYPELATPVVPDSQRNQSAQILLEGMRNGLAAFTQIAQQQRQRESDIAHLALQERLAAEQHAMEQQRLDQAARLIPSQIQANEAHAELQTAQAGAAARGLTTAAGLKMLATQKKEALFNEVAKNVAELQLEDVDFQTKNPVQFGRNAEAFAKMYRFSPVPEIRSAIKQYRSVANEQKIMLKHAVAGEDGTWKTSGAGQHVPLWKVAEAATNPATQEQTFRDLEASGHTDLLEQVRDVTDKFGTHKQTVKTTTLHEPVKSAIQSAMTPVDYGTEEAATPARVRVKSPDGTVGTVAADQLQSALDKGFTQLQ